MLRALTLVAALVVALPADAAGKRVARPFTTVQKVARSEVAFAGKVTDVTKDPVMLPRFPGDANKYPHLVATLKVEKALVGSDKLTEVKVAFHVPPKRDPNARPPRSPFGQVELAAGDSGVFFLTKHQGGDYYTVAPMMNPLDAKDDGYKAAADVAAKAAAALADPARALKADKPADRYVAAVALLHKYRSSPEGATEVETAKVPADQSRLILKALAEGDWSQYDANTGMGSEAFYMLGLTEKDKWVAPLVVNTPGAPPVDFNAALRDTFVKWTDGAGKDYQISRLVAKPKK